MMLGLAIIAALQVANNRGGIANQALEASVHNTKQISVFFSQMQANALSYAEEKGRNQAQFDTVKADLRAEQERSRHLIEKLAAEKAESQASMDQLRKEAQSERSANEAKIEALQKKIDNLESIVAQIRSDLHKAEAEKAALEKERDTLKANYTTLQTTIDQKVVDAVEQVKSDLRFEYDVRLRAKDTEIAQLKNQLSQFTTQEQITNENPT